MTYTYDSDARYHKLHTWVRLDGDAAVVGVSDYAQQRLSDVMWVELPAVGSVLRQGETLCFIESIKSSGEAYAPVSGEVIEVNGALESKSELVNRSPYGEGWIARVRLAHPEELEGLMAPTAYGAFVDEEERTGGH